MASDSPEPAALSPRQPSPAPQKPMSRRRKKKLLVAVVVIAVALVVVFWGWSSTGGSYITVGEIVRNSSVSVPAKYQGTIEIRGTVSAWSGLADVNFTLSDEEHSNYSISVTMMGTYPAGFENGKPVIVKGSLDQALPLHLTASSISVGCSSKY